MRRLLPPFVALCALSLGAGTAESRDAPKFSKLREFWTAEQLYGDFVAEFAADIDSCYPAVTLEKGPPAPDGPESAGKRWKKAIVAIDSSGSMAGRIGGRRKMEAAKQAVTQFLTTVPADAEVGIVAFGHQGTNEESGKARSCKGVELLAAPKTVDGPALSQTLDRLDATGWTPLAAAIAKAGESFTPSSTPGEQVVFVVSDGVETCGGDPVAAARALRDSDVRAIVNIVGFDIAAKDRQALEDVASAGGGTFSQAADVDELVESMRVTFANRGESDDFLNESRRILGDNVVLARRGGSDAGDCIRHKLTDERDAYRKISNAMVEAGTTDRETAEEGFELLVVRHQEIDARTRAFVDKLQADLAATNGKVEADAARIKALYE